MIDFLQSRFVQGLAEIGGAKSAETCHGAGPALTSRPMTRRPWWLKAGIQGTLSLLPEPQRWNRLLQRYVTRSIRLRPSTFAAKTRQALGHLAHWRRDRADLPETALELGTGWHPIVPIGLSLLGVEKIYTLDITSMVSARTLAETLRAYSAWLDEGDPPDGICRPRAAALQSLAAAPISDVSVALATLGIDAVVVDARCTDLPSASIDLFVSNNTLEHLPEETIVDVFSEYRRLASAQAMMSHYVDMKDHYAGFDPSITVYNFLKFSDATWRVFNNDLQYQNRLRVSDFRRIHDRAGWTIRHEDNECDPAAFDRVRLASKFRGYRREDCMVYGSWLISERGTPL